MEKQEMQLDALTTTKRLAELLQCGRKRAKSIGKAAGAEVRTAGRTYWNLNKIRAYIKGSDQDVL